VLIRALAELPDAFLWLAGEGEERAALTALAEKTGTGERIRFLGWRDDTAALLAASDVLVCPSRVEPLGNVVIEGWAHRRPVVAAAAAGPAWLIEDQPTGLLAPIDDPAALAASIRRVLGDTALAARMVDAGRRAYEERFEETSVVAQYVALFEKAVG